MHFNLSAAKLFRETTKLEAGTCRPKTIRERLADYPAMSFVFVVNIRNTKQLSRSKTIRGDLKLPTKKRWSMSTKNILCRPKTIRGRITFKTILINLEVERQKNQIWKFYELNRSSVKSNRQEYPIIVRNLRFLNQKAVFDSNHTSFSQKNATSK